MKVGCPDDDTHAALTDDPVDAELTREYSSHRNHRSRVSHTIHHSPNGSTTWPWNRARSRQVPAATRAPFARLEDLGDRSTQASWRRTPAGRAPGCSPGGP